jgi:hypothetical protein
MAAFILMKHPHIMRLNLLMAGFWGIKAKTPPQGRGLKSCKATIT